MRRRRCPMPFTRACASTELALAGPEWFGLGGRDGADPLALVFGQFAGLSAGEHAVVQLVARPATGRERAKLLSAAAASLPADADRRAGARDACGRAASAHRRAVARAARARPRRPDRARAVLGVVRRAARGRAGAGHRPAAQQAPRVLLRRPVRAIIDDESPASAGLSWSTATEIRTPVSAVRGRCPSPLDDGGASGARIAKGFWTERCPGVRPRSWR
jgi:hypothetical protein